MIDRTLIHRIVAQVAGSYLAREMDRRWIDDLLANTAVGARLRKLTPAQVRGMEVLMYTVVAYVSQSNTNPSALRTVFQQVLSDLPIEIVKRLMDAHNGTPKDVRSALDAMSDEELIALYREIVQRMRPSAAGAGGSHLMLIADNTVGSGTDQAEGVVPPPFEEAPQIQPTAIREAADGIAAWRKSFRERHLNKP
jgi:hypothetical protein